MDLQSSHGTGVLFITHDFGVVADIADRVAVMQHGKIVEIDTAQNVLNNPQHPYTKTLIAAVPSLTPRAIKPVDDDALLKVDSLVKTFRSGGRFFGLGSHESVVKAVDNIDIELHRGETLGIVGESGSGKSTLARCIVRLVDAEAGTIELDGTDIRPLGRAAMRPFRSRIQMVFQDPFASLNPRSSIGNIIADGPTTLGESRDKAEATAREMLELVGLDERAFDRYPHEFSGGQRQRIGIARALALRPAVLVADEPVGRHPGTTAIVDGIHYPRSASGSAGL